MNAACNRQLHAAFIVRFLAFTLVNDDVSIYLYI